MAHVDSGRIAESHQLLFLSSNTAHQLSPNLTVFQDNLAFRSQKFINPPSRFVHQKPLMVLFFP